MTLQVLIEPAIYSLNFVGVGRLPPDLRRPEGDSLQEGRTLPWPKSTTTLFYLDKILPLWQYKIYPEFIGHLHETTSPLVTKGWWSMNKELCLRSRSWWPGWKLRCWTWYLHRRCARWIGWDWPAHLSISTSRRIITGTARIIFNLTKGASKYEIFLWEYGGEYFLRIPLTDSEGKG